MYSMTIWMSEKNQAAYLFMFCNIYSFMNMIYETVRLINP